VTGDMHEGEDRTLKKLFRIPQEKWEIQAQKVG
jgi:hypothetical protein